MQLLHLNGDDANYRLSLAFDRQQSQQKWVATDLHQEVWPAIADQCVEFPFRVTPQYKEESIVPSTNAFPDQKTGLLIINR